MSVNVRTLPAGQAQAAKGPSGLVAHAKARPDTRAALAALALLAIVVCSLLIVLMAADRPSFLSATTHSYFFPGWMAGPLGGLWPGLTRSNTALQYLFSGAVVVMFVGYLLGLKYVSRLRPWAVISAIVAVHLIFLLAPPLALTDIFNYVNYGRMEVVHHLNPYTTVPILEPHDDPSFALSNWHHLLSPYGPLFTLLSFAIVPLGVAASFWAFKAILMLASLATLLLVWKCAKLLGRDPAQAVLFVGLNPIVLVWGLGGDHNDFIMVLCLMLGFYLLLRTGVIKRARGSQPEQGDPIVTSADLAGAGETGVGRARSASGSEVASSRVLSPSWFGEMILPLLALELAAGAALITAVALKASAGILLVVVMASLRHRPRHLVQLLIGMIAAGVIISIASLVAFGPHLPDLSTQGSLVTSVSVPNLLGLALGQGGETDTLRHILSVVLVFCVIASAAAAWRREEPLAASGWATIALLVTLSWVLPWYILWVLPLAVLSDSRRLRTVTLVLSAYLIFAWTPLAAKVFSAVHFSPSKTSLGEQHQRIVKELLN